MEYGIFRKYHSKTFDTPSKQTLQHLQGGTGSGGPAVVLHGAWRGEDVPAWRDAGGCRRAWAVGSIHGARMLQIRDAWLQQGWCPERIKDKVFVTVSIR